MAIIKRELTTLNDSKHTTRLKTTVDYGGALDEVREAIECGNGRIGNGSGEMCIMFKVPEEAWALDPLLKKAQFFRRHGDEGQFNHYLRMWMKLNPKLCIPFQPKLYVTK